MPMNRSRYPEDWEATALKIKEAANWHCQECDRPCKKPGESWDEFELRLLKENHNWLSDYFEAKGRFILTVSHTDHDPENSNARLKALCSSCHLRYDSSQRSRRLQLSWEREGQLKLDLSGQKK